MEKIILCKYQLIIYYYIIIQTKYILYLIINNRKYLKLFYMGIGDWGLGIGPNPQSPIPNPQSPIPMSDIYILNNL